MEMTASEFIAVSSKGLALGLIIGLVRSAFLFSTRQLFGFSRAVLRQ